MATTSRLERNQSWARLIFSIPALAVYALGTLVPIVMGFGISLTDWNGLSSEMRFIGMENYSNIVSEPRFWDSFWFTLVFTVGNTVVQNILALAFALMVDMKLKGTPLFRTMFFAPALLSPIIIGFLWSQIFGTILPTITRGFGWDIDFNILSHPDSVTSGLLIINNWQWVGYWMMIYLAALQGVPQDLYEAATIDGANASKKFAVITVPMIMPAITVCLVSITIGSFQVYELILTATQGGPGHASESFVLYIYNLAFSAEKPAFATANSMIFVVFLLAIALIQVRTLRNQEVQQ